MKNVSHSGGVIGDRFLEDRLWPLTAIILCLKPSQARVKLWLLAYFMTHDHGEWLKVVWVGCEGPWG